MLEIELPTTTRSCCRSRFLSRHFSGKIVDFQKLTHDIRGVQIALDAPLKFWAGQYVDITVTTEAGEEITRSFSMANPPSEAQELGFIIKKYPDGRFSNELDDGGIKAGAEVSVEGPYGMCFRRDGREGPLILVGAGSGMSPVWSILNDHIESGEERPVYFFYGARSRDDLILVNEIKALTDAGPAIEFIPVLSHADDDADWTGERGFVHEAVDRRLKELGIEGDGDVYACGPPPMIDALTPVLFMHDFDSDRISSTSSRPLPVLRAIDTGPNASDVKSTKGGYNGSNIQFRRLRCRRRRRIRRLEKPQVQLLYPARQTRNSLRGRHL